MRFDNGPRTHAPVKAKACSRVLLRGICSVCRRSLVRGSGRSRLIDSSISIRQIDLHVDRMPLPATSKANRLSVPLEKLAPPIAPRPIDCAGVCLIVTSHPPGVDALGRVLVSCSQAWHSIPYLVRNSASWPLLGSAVAPGPCVAHPS